KLSRRGSASSRSSSAEARAASGSRSRSRRRPRRRSSRGSGRRSSGCRRSTAASGSSSSGRRSSSGMRPSSPSARRRSWPSSRGHARSTRAPSPSCSSRRPSANGSRSASRRRAAWSAISRRGGSSSRRSAGGSRHAAPSSRCASRRRPATRRSRPRARPSSAGSRRDSSSASATWRCCARASTRSGTRCSSASVRCAGARWPTCARRSPRRSRRRASATASPRSRARGRVGSLDIPAGPGEGAPRTGLLVMPERPQNVDPPDLGLLPTFRRLLGLWRAQWRLGVFALVLAFFYTTISITIPLLTQRAVDNAIVSKADRLWPYVAAIVALAAVRFVVNFSRRYATARIGIRIEARMRELLYWAYLRYPRAFYDRHATGQVLSRATNDLYPIRYFIGWGLVQGMQSLMMIVAAGIVLLIVNPRLALYTAVAMPPITVLALRFARRVSPLSRQVQERKGDVTEAADEAVVGIEMVQAFGREDDVRSRFGEKAEAVRDTVLRQAGVEARHLPGLYYLPSLSIAAVVFFGGRQVIGGHLSIGEFVLFETLLLQLVWPLEALGWITNLAQRALASAGRSFAWLEGIEPLPEPESPRQLPAGPLAIRFDGVRFAYGGE